MTKTYPTSLLEKMRFSATFFLLIYVNCALASERHFFDDFQGEKIIMPDGSRKLYPNPKSWGYTLSPGVKWPDSYGNGTNYLEANGECQIYLHPFVNKIDGKPLPIDGRFDPFDVTKDGLKITARPLSPEQRVSYKAGKFRFFGSGILITKFSFKYAKIKVVAKLPSADGSWPAIWMLAKNDIWPPEMDILEGMPWGKHKNEIHSGFIGTNDEKSSSFGDWYKINADISKSFHTYELDWSESNIQMKFDNNIIWSRPTPLSMHQEMYLIINLAVGGKWPYNELGIAPIDGIDEKRLSLGSAKISPGFPDSFILKSVDIKYDF